MFSGKLILGERAYVEIKHPNVDSLKVFLSVDHLENLSHPQKYLDPSSKTADSVHLK